VYNAGGGGDDPHAAPAVWVGWLGVVLFVLFVLFVWLLGCLIDCVLNYLTVCWFNCFFCLGVARTLI